MIAATAGKKISNRSEHMETTLQRSQRQQSLNFFFSEIAAITAIVAIIWKPGLRDRNTYTALTDDLSLDRKCV